MHHEPAALDCEVKSRAIFHRGALVAEQECGVDDSGVDAAILHRLEGAGVLRTDNDPRSGLNRARLHHTGATRPHEAGLIIRGELIPFAIVWLDPGITPWCKNGKSNEAENLAKVDF